MFKMRKIVLIACMGMLSTGFAYAATETASTISQAYLGGLIGLAKPSSDGLNSRTTFGINVGYKVAPELAVGGFFTTSSESNLPMGPSVTGNQRISLYGAEASYFFPYVEGLHVGARLGLATESANVNVNTPGLSISTGGSTTDLALGPTVGYDYKLMPNFSLGAEGNILFVTAANSHSVSNFLGALKYWF